MSICDIEIENCILQSIEDIQDVTITKRALENDVAGSGNNFCSEASRFILHYEKNGKKYEKSFFLKIPYNIRNYEFFKRANFYAKEVHMYEIVLPTFRSLLPDDDSPFPQFYGTDGKEALILEDLSRSGYRMQNRLEQLDFEHCVVAFKLLAKFHALGVRTQETQPKILKGVPNETFLTSATLGSESLKNLNSMMKKRFKEIVYHADSAYAMTHSEVVSYLQNNLQQLAKDALKPDTNSFNVLNHGDYWTNNILFGYDSFGLVINAKCVDFQLCRWGSPAIDIIYFTINSMRCEIYDKYFDLLLDVYVSALNASLEYLKCNQRLRIDDLRRNLKEKWIYLLSVLVMITPVILSNPENKTIAENTWSENIANEKRYLQLSKFWISNFIKNGIFSMFEDVAVAISEFIRKFEAENDTVVSQYSLENDVVNTEENFCSGIRRLRFEYKKNENMVLRSVLLKIPSDSSNYNYLKQTNMYNIEIYMYEKILPDLYRLWNGERFSPMFYAATKSKVLILEDLTAEKFHPYKDEKQLNLEHCRIALVTLAKYHALSVIYLQNYSNLLPAMFNGVKSTPALDAFGNSMLDNFLQLTEPVISKSMYEKLQEFKRNLSQSSIYSITADDGDLNVIIHGDFWRNNILFQYDENKRVNAARIIDWQLCRKISVAIDLIYFLVTSVKFEVFEIHQDSLLNLYLNTMNETLCLLRCDCVYTRSQLNADLEKYKCFYLECVGIPLQVVMSDQREIAAKITAKDNMNDYLSVAVKWLKYLATKGII